MFKQISSIFIIFIVWIIPLAKSFETKAALITTKQNDGSLKSEQGFIGFLDETCARENSTSKTTSTLLKLEQELNESKTKLDATMKLTYYWKGKLRLN